MDLPNGRQDNEWEDAHSNNFTVAGSGRFHDVQDFGQFRFDVQDENEPETGPRPGSPSDETTGVKFRIETARVDSDFTQSNSSDDYRVV